MNHCGEILRKPTAAKQSWRSGSARRARCSQVQPGKDKGKGNRDVVGNKDVSLD
jgi:hypothetical protein